MCFHGYTGHSREGLLKYRAKNDIFSIFTVFERFLKKIMGWDGSIGLEGVFGF